jgi:hypothetical protein
MPHKARHDIPRDIPQGLRAGAPNPGMASAAKLIESTDVVVAFGWGDHSQLLVGADGLQERMMIEFEPAAALTESRFQAGPPLAQRERDWAYFCMSSIEGGCRLH